MSDGFSAFFGSIMPRYFFEDFHAGDEWEYEPWSLDIDGIVAFARQYDPQPMHTDPDSPATAPYGGLIASGWQTALKCLTPFLDEVMRETAGLASPGFDSFRWLKPVRPGARIRPRVEVFDSRRSRSKPDRGIVFFRFQGLDEGNEAVWSAEGPFLIRCRAIERK